MKSKTDGKRISKRVEVTNVTRNGVWLLVRDREYFLPYGDFPWFKNATIGQVINVKLVSPGHLFWPDLDVDLDVESLENTENYPLVYKS